MSLSKLSTAMRLITFEPKLASQQAFVDFWSARYQYDKEPLYTDNIGRELTAQRVFDLFTWKNGTPLSAEKRESVNQHFVLRLGELAALRVDEPAEAFLDRFNAGGAIWRIFWLHCWRQQFPIFDQHVYRAMQFIEAGTREEIPGGDPEKVKAYIRDYLPFYGSFASLDGRAVDKALWAFGKFIAENNFPLQAAR